MHTSVEEFDVGSEKWTMMATHLPCERKYHTACELNGKRSLFPVIEELVPVIQWQHPGVSQPVCARRGTEKRAAHLQGGCLRWAE